MTEQTIIAQTLAVDTLGFDRNNGGLVFKYRQQVIDNIGKINKALGKAPFHEGLLKRYNTLKQQLVVLDKILKECPTVEIVYKSYL